MANKKKVGQDLEIDGNLTATTKSFLIKHPLKKGKRLQYGNLEGPEHAVYVRGRLTGGGIIELPDYWVELVNESTITVQLTPVGKFQQLYVDRVEDNKVFVVKSWGDKLLTDIDCFYFIQAERKDVDKLQVEL